MITRVLVLAALAAALAVPAVSLADGSSGSTPAPATAAKGARVAGLVGFASKQLDRRYQRFSGRCLVASPPEQCGKVAGRLVKRLDRLQKALHRVEGKITEKCSAASPPPRCSKAGQVTQAIDALLAKLSGDEAAIKAAFPEAAGS